MKRMILIATLGFIFSVQYASGQSTEKKPCPVIVLAAPPFVEEGDSLILKVNPLGKDFDNLSVTYNWFISNGSISNGQGTAAIYIDSKGLKGSSVTATVEVAGLPPACASVSSATVEVIEKAPKTKATPKSKPKAVKKTD